MRARLSSICVGCVSSCLTNYPGPSSRSYVPFLCTSNNPVPSPHPAISFPSQIVAIHYQSALLDAFIEDPFESNFCVIVDEETLESMSLYLGHVATYIDALRDWLASERYMMLQGIAKKAVSEMRNSIASATGSPGRRNPPSCVPQNARSIRGKSKVAEVPFARLDSFLRRLSPDHFSGDHSPSSSTTVELPISPLDAVADVPLAAGSFSPLTSTPSPFPMSLAEWELDHHQDVEPQRRHSLTSSDTTCVEEQTLGSPLHLETNVHSSPKETAGQTLYEPAFDACESPPVRPSLKRRRRTTSTLKPSSSSSSLSDFNSESSHPRKRRRQISLRMFGPDGTAEDVETETYTHMRAYVGRVVPVRGAFTGHASSPTSLPPRNLSVSPNSSQASASTLMRTRSLSPLGLGVALIPPPSESADAAQAVWSGETSAVPRWRGSMLLEPGWRSGVDGIEVGVDSGSGESDGESFTTADDRLYEDVQMDGEDERAVDGSSSGADLSREEEARLDNHQEKDTAPGAPSRTSSLPSPPVLSCKAKGKRRCFADLFRTFRHIFSGR